MAYSEALADRIRGVRSGRDGVTEKKMFGGLAFLVNGHMTCGVNDDRLMLRLNHELAAEALEKPHVSPMDFTGKPIKTMAYVEPAGIAEDDDLRYWVELADEFARTLPPK